MKHDPQCICNDCLGVSMRIDDVANLNKLTYGAKLVDAEGKEWMLISINPVRSGGQPRHKVFEGGAVKEIPGRLGEVFGYEYEFRCISDRTRFDYKCSMWDTLLKKFPDAERYKK